MDIAAGAGFMQATENAQESPPLWRRLVFGRSPRRTLIRAAVTAVVLIGLCKFVLLPVRIEGASMEPTYRDHGFDFINRLAYVRTAPQRGDVVAIRFSGLHVMLFKRIIGLPGETVAFVHGQALVNGLPLDEPYVKFRSAWNEEPKKLGPDEYYFVGDNRGMPARYHEHGITSRVRIVGKALW